MSVSLSQQNDDHPVGQRGGSSVGQRAFSSGIVLAIVGTFLFALKSIFIKLAFAAGADPTLLLSLRLGLALPFYVVVLCFTQLQNSRERLTKRQVVQAVALGFLGYYLASYLDLAGLQHITAQLERLTLFIYPAIIAVLAWMFLGEPINRRVIASILLCYFGIAVMYSQERLLVEGQDITLGVGLVLASAISYAAYVLLAKPMIKRMGSRQFTSFAMIGSTFFVGVHFAATRDVREFVAISPAVYVYALVLAIACTVIPSFMINEAMARIGAPRTAVIGTVGPVITMLLAIGVLGEPSSIWHFAGMGLAVTGVSLVTRNR